MEQVVGEAWGQLSLRKLSEVNRARQALPTRGRQGQPTGIPNTGSTGLRGGGAPF